MVIPNIIM